VSVSTMLGQGRLDVLTPGDLETARRERLCEAEREREAGLALPPPDAFTPEGFDPLDGRARWGCGPDGCRPISACRLATTTRRGRRVRDCTS
jgi:hypothetical protein